MKQTILVSFCWLVFIGTATIARGQGFAVKDMNLDDWHNKYTQCFKENKASTQNNLYHLIDLGDNALKTYASDDARRSYVTSLMIDANLYLSQWNNAEALLLHMRTSLVSPSTSQLTENAKGMDWINQRLAGVYAIKGECLKSVMFYVYFLGHKYTSIVLPRTLICLCYAIICFCKLQAHWKQVRKQALAWLILVALLPFFLTLFTDLVEPLNSVIVAGNAGMFLVSAITKQFTSLYTMIEISLLLISTSCILNMPVVIYGKFLKMAIPSRSSPGTNDDRVSPWVSKKSVPLIVSVISTGSLVIFDLLQSYQTYQGMVKHTSASKIFPEINTPLHFGIAFTTIALFPLAEELFFRRSVIKYVRSISDQSFAMVFSVLIFATAHTANSDFYIYVWAGIIYSTLYEVTNSIIPSLICHSIHNLIFLLSEQLR